MEIKLVKLKLFEMTTTNLKNFWKNIIQKLLLRTKLIWKKAYNYTIYPRDSKISTEKRYVNNDDVSLGGTHWTCFFIKDNKSYYFDSFDGQLDNLIHLQLPKPIIFHIYKIQDININY